MRKKLLFIEDQLLQYDQSAGARTSYLYLKLLMEMGLSVTFIAADFKTIEPYAGHLKALGVKVMTGRWFEKSWKLWFTLCVHRFDYVFFNRPFPTHMFIRYVETFSRAKILYQCHDLHYLRLQRQYEVDGDRETLDMARSIEAREMDLIRRSDVFLTFSQLEKTTIEQRLPGQRAEVLPLFFYDELPPPAAGFSERQGLLFVGGFKHQPNLDGVLWFSREVLPKIKRERPDVVFHIVGSHPPAEIDALAGDDIKVHGYIDDEQLAKLYQSVRLVVVPLRFGAGVKGKTVEAAYHALPLVATGIGSEGIGLEGIIPATDTPQDFAERVVALYQDEAAWRECSNRLHAYALHNLTATAAKARLGVILNSLGDRPEQQI